MKEILLINPKKKRTKRKKRRSAAGRPRTKTGRFKKMRAAPKRKTKKRAPAKRSASPKKRGTTMAAKKKRAPAKRKRPYKKRNPSAASRRAYSRARSTFAGLNIKGALKDVPATQLGMFATKWLAKRFGPDATEIDPESWNWSSYLKGGLGAVLAGFIAQMVKPGMGQKVMAGGLNLMFYKMIQNELVADSTWASEQFGAQEDPDYLPGDVETGTDGREYFLGQDYQWHQLPDDTSMSGPLEPVGPLGAYEPLQPVGPLGDADLDQAYREALLGNA